MLEVRHGTTMLTETMKTEEVLNLLSELKFYLKLNTQYQTLVLIQIFLILKEVLNRLRNSVAVS